MEESKSIASTTNNYELSKLRLNLLRAIYGLTFLSLGTDVWMYILSPGELIKSFDGVTYSFWAAYATLMGIGVFLPKKMLPLIMLQLFYKSVWLLGVFLPLWMAKQITIESSDLFNPFIIAVILDTLVIPWPYVFKHYLRKDL